MMIELLCRYAKGKNSVSALTKEQQEELDGHLYSQELIQGDKFDEDKVRDEFLKKLGIVDADHEYGPLTFNIKDVKAFNFAGEGHTCLRFYDGTANTFVIEYNTFVQVYEQLTGNFVNDLSNIIILNTIPQPDGEGEPNKDEQSSLDQDRVS